MPSRYDRGASSDDVKKITTEDVMLLAFIIVRRHLTSTLYVLVCINPVLRWTAEGNSGLGFHQKQSSRLEEVMCTWIMCTWRLNLLLHILQVHCVKGFISRSFSRSLVAPSFADETTYHSYVFERCCQQRNHQTKRLTTACTCVRAIPIIPLGILRASVSWL